MEILVRILVCTKSGVLMQWASIMLLKLGVALFSKLEARSLKV
jgi:hypothetical protein